MALSDREKKVLEELERGLFADDEDFAKRVQSASPQNSESKATSAKAKSSRNGNPAGRLVGGVLLAVVGLSVLVVATTIQYIVLGVVGFVITLTGLVISSSNWSNSSLQQKSRPARKPSSGKGFFEEQWDRRFNSDN